MKKQCNKAIIGLATLSLLMGGDLMAAKSAVPGGSKHNSKAPIDVTSDSLEVMQTENKAIFTGHVVAIQGDTRLTADKMTVFYTSNEKKEGKKPDKKTENKTENQTTDTAKKPKKGDKGSDNTEGAIKKIVPEGHVFLTTPEETASGDNGIYDVENQKIYLNDHVILTHGKNVLKGDKLVYNFATGKSVLTSGNEPVQPGGKGKQRVHALFVPEDKKPETTDKTTDTKKGTSSQ